MHSATQTTRAVSNENTGQYLTFRLGSEEYALDILKVEEIKGWKKPTRLPNVSDYVLGTVNHRGTIVPIIDLRRRFGLEQAAFDQNTVIIMAKITVGDSNERIIGMVVDAMSEIYDLGQNDIRPVPDLGGEISVQFVRGIATPGEKMLILLDAERVIDYREYNVIEKMVRSSRTKV